MSETAAKVETPPRARVRRAPRVVLYEVDWKTYSRMLYTLGNRPGTRLTYDRGTLEIMTPLFVHDWSSRFLARLIFTLSEELEVPIVAGGATTLRRKLKKHGLGPDESFWIANESKIRGKKRIDLKKDPPPDLAIEVDVTSSSLSRMNIYAALNVPEVWRFEENTLIVYGLDDNKVYAVMPASLSFAGLTAQDLMPFLELCGQMDDTAIVNRFRRWVRQRFNVSPRP